jgi:hypothetical protein
MGWPGPGACNLPSWLERPWADLDAVLGPLRPIEFQSRHVYPAVFNVAPSFGE